MIAATLPAATSPGAPAAPGSEDRLREAAVRLEAAFLAEMLKHSGLGRPPEGLGGGSGEAQFASFLVEAQAQEIARAGGIGLAESLFSALVERSHD